MTMPVGWRQRDPGIGRFLRLRRGEIGRVPPHCGTGRRRDARGLKALGAGNSSWSSTSNKITNAMKDRAP